MAAARYPTRHNGRRGLGVMETSLALSVIIGLLFVAVRVMNMGMPANWTQTSDAQTVVVKTEAVPLAPGDPGTRTP